MLDYPIHGVPFLEVRYQDKVREKGFITQKRYLNDIPNRISLTNPSNIEIYFENLKATGIFLIQNNACFFLLKFILHWKKGQEQNLIKKVKKYKKTSCLN